MSELEPGLALMDEIGRTALTNAFINFIRNTCDPSAYRDSLIYAGCRVTNVDETSLTATAGEMHRKSAFRMGFSSSLAGIAVAHLRNIIFYQY